ncbi:MAG TPA: rhamnogalacturonan acetylesterase [Niallia sp.]|nr:rhamnogalacturonan acetylesterase [Niallia sp.]
MKHNPIKVFLAADSTVQQYEDDPYQGGWGEFLSDYFTKEVEVVNHAIGGRSSKTFVEEGRLTKIVESMGTGDYLLIQMGHNDATKSRPERYTEPFTTYKEYLKIYIKNARLCQAEPVLITPVARLHYENGVFINDFPEYCQAMKEVATEENVRLIDLMERSLHLFEALGYQEVLPYFMASINTCDYTHFTKKGANEMAKLVAAAIKEQIQRISVYIKM